MNDQSELITYLDPERPFSPLDAGALKPDSRHIFFDSKLDLFRAYQRKPQIIVGRRGAGKTAFLESAHFSNPKDLIVSINKATCFGQIVLSIEGIPQGGRYPEAIASLWDSVITTIIIDAAVKRYPELRISRDYLGKIGTGSNSSPESIGWTLLNTLRDVQKGKTVGTIAELISRLHSVSYHEAKQELVDHLNKRKEKVLVLMDSLESEGYILDDPNTLSALKGLLKWIGDIGESSDPIHIRVSIPGEYYFEFVELSSNPIKDFGRSSVLKWQPRQLISLAASRLLLSLSVRGNSRYNKWNKIDISDPTNAVRLFDEFLPKKNPVEMPGGALLFMLRHTQLVPRHFFLILNEFFSHVREGEEAAPNSVTSAVEHTANLIVREIFGAYSHRYPKAAKVVGRILPQMPEVFTFDALENSWRRYGRAEFEEFLDFVDMLFDIGAMGVIVDRSSNYLKAQFQYDHTHRMNASPKDTFCMHPTFRLMFREAQTSIPSRIYPVGTSQSVES